MQSTSKTVLGSCQDLIRYLNDGVFLVGVGNTSAWPVDASPPEVDPGILLQPELVGYFPVKKILVVYPHVNGSIVLANGLKYYALDSRDPYEMAQVGATSLLVEADIIHSQLVGVTSYRSVGLYTSAVVSGAIENLDFIGTGRVARAVLDTLIHLDPKQDKQAGVTHTIQLVRSFNVIQ